MEELKYFTLNDNATITNSFDILQQRVDDMEATLNELAERLTVVANQLGVSATEAGAIISSAFQKIYSHAEGASNTVTDYYSHAEGVQSRAYNAYTVAEGYHNCDGNALIDDMNIEKGWDWLDHDVD